MVEFRICSVQSVIFVHWVEYLICLRFRVWVFQVSTSLQRHGFKNVRPNFSDWLEFQIEGLRPTRRPPTQIWWWCMKHLVNCKSWKIRKVRWMQKMMFANNNFEHSSERFEPKTKTGNIKRFIILSRLPTARFLYGPGGERYQIPAQSVVEDCSSPEMSIAGLLLDLWVRQT